MNTITDKTLYMKWKFHINTKLRYFYVIMSSYDVEVCWNSSSTASFTLYKLTRLSHLLLLSYLRQKKVQCQQWQKNCLKLVSTLIMIHLVLVFFRVAAIFIFYKSICIWTWGATTMPPSHWAFHSMFLAGASSSSTISSTVAPYDL